MSSAAALPPHRSTPTSRGRLSGPFYGGVDDDHAAPLRQYHDGIEVDGDDVVAQTFDEARKIGDEIHQRGPIGGRAPAKATQQFLDCAGTAQHAFHLMA